MKRINQFIITISLVCFSIVGAVFADDMRHHQTVSFDKPVMINGTLVEKGKYRVTFDVQKREVKFAKHYDGDVVLVTKAEIEVLPDEADVDSVTTTETGSSLMVKKLVFKGHEEAAVFGEKLAVVGE
jgi:hypothetical protein